MSADFRALLARARQKFANYEMDAEEPAPYEHRMLMDEIDAALAANPDPAPEGGPSVDELAEIIYREAVEDPFQYPAWADLKECYIKQCVQDAARAVLARAVLARYGTPAPVPVAERLPEAGDCDAHGRCWWFTPKEGNTEPFRCADWSFYAGWRQKYTHWLPHWALPLPAQPEQP